MSIISDPLELCKGWAKKRARDASIATFLLGEMKKYLYISQKCDTISLRRRSILVEAAGSQEGPKNPLKGISMKSLVFAFCAQLRVDAGG